MSGDLTPEVIGMVDKALVDRAEAIRVLPVAEVARLLGVSQKTVRRFIDTGELAHTRIGARLGVRQRDVAAYIAAHTHGGQAAAS